MKYNFTNKGRVNYLQTSLMTLGEGDRYEIKDGYVARPIYYILIRNKLKKLKAIGINQSLL